MFGSIANFLSVSFFVGAFILAGKCPCFSLNRVEIGSGILVGYSNSLVEFDAGLRVTNKFYLRCEISPPRSIQASDRIVWKEYAIPIAFGLEYSVLPKNRLSPGIGIFYRTAKRVVEQGYSAIDYSFQSKRVVSHQLTPFFILRHRLGKGFSFLYSGGYGFENKSGSMLDALYLYEPAPPSFWEKLLYGDDFCLNLKLLRSI